MTTVLKTSWHLFLLIFQTDSKFAYVSLLLHISAKCCSSLYGNTSSSFDIVLPLTFSSILLFCFCKFENFYYLISIILHLSSHVNVFLPSKKWGQARINLVFVNCPRVTLIRSFSLTPSLPSTLELRFQLCFRLNVPTLLHSHNSSSHFLWLY